MGGSNPFHHIILISSRGVRAVSRCEHLYYKRRMLQLPQQEQGRASEEGEGRRAKKDPGLPKHRIQYTSLALLYQASYIPQALRFYCINSVVCSCLSSSSGGSKPVSTNQAEYVFVETMKTKQEQWKAPTSFKPKKTATESNKTVENGRQAGTRCRKRPKPSPRTLLAQYT